MQKPEFIKIVIPAGRLDVTPQVKRFFNRARNQFLEVEFSRIRHRKVYKYKVENAEAFQRYFLTGKISDRGFILKLTKFQ